MYKKGTEVLTSSVWWSVVDGTKVLVLEVSGERHQQVLVVVAVTAASDPQSLKRGPALMIRVSLLGVNVLESGMALAPLMLLLLLLMITVSHVDDVVLLMGVLAVAAGLKFHISFGGLKNENALF